MLLGSDGCVIAWLPAMKAEGLRGGWVFGHDNDGKLPCSVEVEFEYFQSAG
ncbi:MAG: hypothetical protein RL447_1224 [Bacteroidota bacterium]|jgi:hypothetical protein